MTTQKKEYLDLTIFKDNQATNCTNGDYTECAAIDRVIVALRYYATMNVKNNENDREIFRSFMEEMYQSVLDDNNHFMSVHSEQLNEICDVLMDGGECTMSGCAASQRHFESENNLNIADDQNINFYVNLMDSLHFIICHCYDCGMRVKQNENYDDEDDKTLFDAEFSRMNTIIRKTNSKTAPFERISAGNNSKFVISKTEQGDTTFLDELYKHLESKSMFTGNLKAFVENEFYDIDSIKMDVLNYENIQICKQAILHFVNAIRVQSNIFSVGFRFYYWSHYEHLDSLPMNEQMLMEEIDNTHDHGGYKVAELFVKAKYDSFKKEIAHYPNLNIEQYETAKTKTNKFMKSDKIKKMSAKKTDGSDVFLHYNMAFGAVVLFQHILSLIFYTDYSKLSFDFSATFRQIHSFETLKSIKQRNALYFWMSKYLRELVELFGQCSHGDTFEKYDARGNPIYVDALKGPFYCGMNFKMHVDSFAMRLNSPVSTSKHIEVTLNFTGEDGVIFTFDNVVSMQYEYLRSFACSHISRFKEEDECLFFGGFYRIRVVTVRLISTKQNMKKFVSALFHFDECLTGNNWKMSENECFIIESLVNLALNKRQTKLTLPQYVLNCFAAFRQNKRSLILEMELLYDCESERINNLLFHSLVYGQNDNEFKRSDDDLTNVVHSELFDIFPNVRSLIISIDTSYSFCFSLMTLLNVIFGTNLNEIVIKTNDDDCISWVGQVWSSDKEILKKEYAAKGFQIEMKDVCHTFNGPRYNLSITKIKV